MSEENTPNYQVAIRDFKRARRQAAIQRLLAQLSGRSNKLLVYSEVYQRLGGEGMIDRGIQEIPLDAIVGSVGRYDDFTRDFLPKKDSIQERWAQVKTAVLNMTGMGPISVYQIGEVYFVRDGNHRVSIARQLKTPTITAYVTEVKTKVPLAVDDDLDEVQCKSRYADFLEKTKLDESRPETNLLMTFCDHYDVLYSQIEAHRQKLIDEGKSVVSYQESTTQWYDQVYFPVVEIIREQGILHYFPERTEADLYLLFMKHRDALERALGWHIDTDSTVVDMLERKADMPRNPLSWLGLQLYKTLVPDQLVTGPEPGHWRKFHLARRKQDSLIAHILVGLPQPHQNWSVLKHAIEIAKREKSYLYGLHVVTDMSMKESIPINELRSNFEERCQAEEIEGEFTIEKGNIAEKILNRAAWVDMVVVGLTQPPQTQPLRRFRDEFYLLLQRCTRPLLIVPDDADTQMDRILLAYDGSPKAHEALFVAAYLGLQWSTQLVVVTIETKYTSKTALDRAKAYLNKQGVDNVTYLLRQKPISDSLMKAAEEYESNLFIMGGFGFRPPLNLVLGSTVDRVLREFKQPILICR